MRAVLLLSTALLSACAHAPDGPRTSEVRAEGWAPLGPEGREHARDRALADALRRAAEAAAGVVVEGRSAVRDAASWSSEVLTRSRGVVASWKVLKEEAEDGILRLFIAAKVVEGRPSGGAVALKLSDPRAAAGVARALEEKGIALDRRARTRVTGTAASRALRASVFPGTETFRASAELVVSAEGGAPRRVFGEASALDVDPALAAAKAAEAAGYKAGLALAEVLTRAE